MLAGKWALVCGANKGLGLAWVVRRRWCVKGERGRGGPRPTARATRWPRSRRQDRRGQIKSLLSIHVRPPKVHERQRPGH